MKHDDWLYLVEFFLKRGDVETSEWCVKNMRHVDKSPDPFTKC